MILHYINLTDGIEWIPELPNYHAVRISSTVIEKADWPLLVLELDHDLLFRLSQGVECVVYDCGTRRVVSKTIAIGVPYIKSVLEQAWFGEGAFKRATTVIAQRAKAKVGYCRKLLNTTEVRLRGVSKRTDHDGDYGWYRDLLKNSLGPLCTAKVG